jgi:hypothetical protein
MGALALSFLKKGRAKAPLALSFLKKDEKQ